MTRPSYTVSGLSAGKINARLAGSVHIKGADRLTNGTFYDRLIALAGVTSFRFFVDAVGDANVDDASLFLETAACVDQGSFDYYFEPQNEDGVPGPVSGPFNTTIK